MDALFDPNINLSYQEPYIISIMIGYAILAVIMVAFTIFSKDEDSFTK